tara:strand:+ start:2400 stop:2555 length:156 start_codon:yes stop_codon:yes gene_type:complete
MIDFTDRDILNYLLAFAGKTKDEVLQEMKERYTTLEEFKNFIPDRYNNKLY